jgi:hypothetical protein
MSSQESAEAKALTDATAALEAEIADLSALEPEIASKLAVAQDQLAHVSPVSVEQVNAVAALAHTLGGLTSELKIAAGATIVLEKPEPATPPVSAAPAATGGVAEPPAATPASTEGVPPGEPPAPPGAVPPA